MYKAMIIQIHIIYLIHLSIILISACFFFKESNTFNCFILYAITSTNKE